MKVKPSMDFIQAICELGFSYAEVKRLADDESWKAAPKKLIEGSKRGLAQRINTVSYLRFSEDIERQYGTKVYLASGNAQIEHLVSSYRRWRQINGVRH